MRRMEQAPDAGRRHPDMLDRPRSFDVGNDLGFAGSIVTERRDLDGLP